MLDPANDLLPPPSSPTISSVSSSDLDTEVTFFPLIKRLIMFSANSDLGFFWNSLQDRFFMTGARH